MLVCWLLQSNKMTAKKGSQDNSSFLIVTNCLAKFRIEVNTANKMVSSLSAGGGGARIDFLFWLDGSGCIVNYMGIFVVETCGTRDACIEIKLANVSLFHGITNASIFTSPLCATFRR
jgi:hypothetical protein